jgi:hypothetical protein
MEVEKLEKKMEKEEPVKNNYIQEGYLIFNLRKLFALMY